MLRFGVVVNPECFSGIDKLMLVNQRLMFIFAEVAPNTIFKQNKDSDLPNLPDSSTSTLAGVRILLLFTSHFLINFWFL